MSNKEAIPLEVIKVLLKAVEEATLPELSRELTGNSKHDLISVTARISGLLIVLGLEKTAALLNDTFSKFIIEHY